MAPVAAVSLPFGVQVGFKGTADEPIEGCDRRDIDDPFGNRIELIEPHAK